MLDKVSVILFSLFLKVLRDLFLTDILSKIIIVYISLHFEQIDDTLEVVLSTDRELDRNGVTMKSFMEHIQNVVEVCTHDIHLVDIYHSWHLIVISLSPNCFSLRLNTTLSTKNCYRTVEYTK